MDNNRAMPTTGVTKHLESKVNAKINHHFKFLSNKST